MDDSLFDPGEIARLDQMGAEAINWAEALIKLSAKLRAGGFTSKQADDLTKLWFGAALSPGDRSRLRRVTATSDNE